MLPDSADNDLKPDHNLFTFDGYRSRYCYYLGKGFRNIVAWEKTESDYMEITGGIEKYSSYESWQSIMYRKLKR